MTLAVLLILVGLLCLSVGQALLRLATRLGRYLSDRFPPHS